MCHFPWRLAPCLRATTRAYNSWGWQSVAQHRWPCFCCWGWLQLLCPGKRPRRCRRIRLLRPDVISLARSFRRPRHRATGAASSDIILPSCKVLWPRNRLWLLWPPSDRVHRWSWSLPTMTSVAPKSHRLTRLIRFLSASKSSQSPSCGPCGQYVILFLRQGDIGAETAFYCVGESVVPDGSIFPGLRPDVRRCHGHVRRIAVYAGNAGHGHP